jgi:hypothetical protein
MLFVFGTAWLAIVAWAAANWLRAQCCFRAARVAWTCGAAALLAHVLLAFHIVHHWDHGAAYRDVALQTYERTGLAWGGGIYINYAFTAFWLADAALWWLAPRRYEGRPRWLSGLVQFLFLLMFVNATMVFGSTPAAAMGTVVCAAGALGWWQCGRGSLGERACG